MAGRRRLDDRDRVAGGDLGRRATRHHRRRDGGDGEVMSVTKSRRLLGYQLRVEINQTDGRLAIVSVEPGNAAWVQVAEP
jgi:hypothetical protein